MINIDHDVAIVGAGPAGLQAAKQLEEFDIDYILLSREAVPCENKPCGGFVPRRALEEFQIAEIPDSYDIYSVRMKFPNLEMINVDFDHSIGKTVTRGGLGKTMLASVKNQNSISMSSMVTSLTEREEFTEVKYEQDNSKTMRVRYVIDASGVNAVSIKCGLIRDRIPNSQMGYAIQHHYKTNEKTPYDSDLHFYYGSDYSPKGYAWFFPRKFEAVLGVGGIVSKVRNSTKKLLDYLHDLTQNPNISEALSNSEFIKEEAGLVPLAGIVTPSHSKRVIVVGDAAAHCSPLTGEGIYYSMKAGDIAAKTVHIALTRKTSSISSLSKYESGWKRAFSSDLKWGLWLQKRFTTTDSTSSQKYLSNPKVQRVIAEMLVGEATVRRAMLKVLPRYLLSKIV